MRKPSVSIIILNYNGARDTVECLESLENQIYKKFKVVLVDNGSKEDDLNQIRKFIEKSSLQINLIALKDNEGFTGGNNIGVKYCTEEYIACLNNDTVVEDDWLKNLLKPFFKNNENLVVVGSLIKDYYNRQKIAHYGGRINIFGQFEFSDNRKSLPKKNFVVSGVSFVIKKEVLKEVGTLFCQKFFPGYYEDVDLSWRLYNLGYKISVAPDSIVYHKVSTTFKRENLVAKGKVSYFRNKYLTFYRNLSFVRFLLIFPVLITWDFISVLILSNRARIWIKGILEFFKNIRKIKHIGNGDFSFLGKRIYYTKTLRDWTQ